MLRSKLRVLGFWGRRVTVDQQAAIEEAWRVLVAATGLISIFFFFQAEDGIRDVAVTGVQTCALPISAGIPVARAAFGTGITDAVNGGEQEIVSGTGSRTRRGPQGFQQWPQAGLFGSQPQGAGEAEVSQGGGEGDGGGLLLDEFSEFFGGAEIGLMDGAGLPVDAGAFDEVVVEAGARFFFNQASHQG